MSRLFFPTLAALALSSSPAPAATEGGEGAAIIGAVVRLEAESLRSWSDGPVACASPTVEGSTFEWLERKRDEAAAAESRPRLEEPVIAFRYGPTPGDPDGRMIELEPDEQQRLAEAVDAIAAGNGERPPLAKLRSEWLTPPFRLCDQEEVGLLELSSPVIYGDFAFVSVEFDCAMCGHGIDFALRRRGKAWVIVAENMRWVS
jgi:hypothetical protein